jgi:Tetracyclin repressor-like, C-terminal domain
VGGFHVESLGMRKIVQELGVVPIALHKHRDARARPLGRSAFLRHPWASKVIESRAEPTPTIIGYIDSMMGIFLAGGFSVALVHHAIHVMGSRILGFSQELFDDTTSMPDDEALAMWSQIADQYPNIAALVGEISGGGISHDEESTVGGGCDDQFEFEFALDLMLDGLERLRASA